MELPFKLAKYHKTMTKASWKKLGLNMDNFEKIYQKYIYATHCELCNKQFKTSKDRQMEHDHNTKEFRNIVCNSCNALKADRFNINNTSGYKGIYKYKDLTCKQGYTWKFRAIINGKYISIKTSVNKEKLIAFAEQWKKDNNYHT
jgi:hypothetical protein